MSNAVREGILLPFLLGLVLLKALWAAVTAPIYSTSPSILTHVGNAALRSLLGDLSPTQLQLILPSFLDSYRSYCSNHYIEAPVVPIPDTKASGFWLGDPRKAKFFSLYVHGGGYVIPGSPNSIAFVNQLVKWSNDKLAVFCVAYTLTPEAEYPLALSQCVEGLRYMLSLPQVNPSSTLLTGDSAGGAIVLAILSHISSHPHPNADVVKPLELGDGERLKAAILINPFISGDGARYKSIRTFKNRDNFNKSTANAWLSMYYGGKLGYDKDMYVCPAHADASWWKETKVEQILCTAGEEEALRDSIVDWAGKYREGVEGGGRKTTAGEVVKLVIGEKETHIMPVLAPYEEKKLDELGEKATEGAIRNFIKETLASETK